MKRRRETEESSDQKEGIRSLFFVPSAKWTRGAYSLTGFEVGLWERKHAAIWCQWRGSKRGTVSEHNLRLTPINMGVMFSEPSVAKDNVVHVLGRRRRR